MHKKIWIADTREEGYEMEKQAFSADNFKCLTKLYSNEKFTFKNQIGNYWRGSV
jgi:hypothetical protein